MLVQKRTVLLTVWLPNCGGEGFVDFYNSQLWWSRSAFTTVVVGARIELQGGHSSNNLYRTQPALAGRAAKKKIKFFQEFQNSFQCTFLLDIIV